MEPWEGLKTGHMSFKDSPYSLLIYPGALFLLGFYGPGPASAKGRKNLRRKGMGKIVDKKADIWREK